ncbi:MAG TPA: hypothetical protein VIK72_00795 [Clostridiaceae bacterium]
MNDKFTKFMLAGILLCLIVIADKPTNNQVDSSNPYINFSSGHQIIQLAPDRIAVVDSTSNSGTDGTILVFDYDNNTKKFSFVSTMNYADYFKNPDKYGLPKN